MNEHLEPQAAGGGGPVKHRSGLKARLKRLALMLVLAFVLIVVGLSYTLQGVRENLDRIVEERFQQVVHNSHNSRDFGLLHTRLQVFTKTFYGDQEFLEAESRALLDDFKRLEERVDDEVIANLVRELKREFLVYLEHCRWINVLLDWRSGQDQDINEQLLLLQEIVADRTIEIALAGGDVSYLEQLVLLLSGYRENLLDIARLNAEEKKATWLNSRVDDPPPLHDQLEQLRLRMQTLTASEPPIDKFGRHLLSRLAYYQYLMRLYQLEMIQLGEKGRALSGMAAGILLAMEDSDRQAALSAGETRLVISHNISSTLALILALLSMLAGIFWFSLRNFFGNHIQAPMTLVSERLASFQQGDHQTRMVLNRDDEWGEVEKVFNQMLGDVQESVAALRESEQRYREIFINATEGIFRTSISGRILEINPAAVKILGYDSRDQAIAEVRDFAVQHYHNPRDRKEMVTRLYQQGHNRHFECLLVRRSGERFWAAINNRLIRNAAGEILYIEGTFQDISMRKAAQESLLKLQVYLQNIIDSMPSMLIAIGPEMTITLWNRRAEQEEGLPSCTAIGQPIQKAFRLIDPEHYLNALETTLENRQPTRLMKLEKLIQNDEEEARYFDMVIYPLSETENRGAVIHIDDISERVRLEEMMVRSEKMQSVGSLASGLAHEINNPLAAVLQNVQVLSHRLSPSLAKNRSVAEELGTTIDVIAEYCNRRGCNKMLQSIASAGQRAAKIVENMQSFSRRGDAAFALSSLPELLDRTLELASSDYDMRHQYAFHKIRIQRDFQPVEKILCEPSQIQQVILTILKNAAQALNTHTEDPCITLRVFPVEPERVCLEIEDNGPGMDPETTRQIFDPFYSTRDVGRGIGLGLSIAYFIVSQNHRGNLSVRTEPGRGTCFALVLPQTRS